MTLLVAVDSFGGSVAWLHKKRRKSCARVKLRKLGLFPSRNSATASPRPSTNQPLQHLFGNLFSLRATDLRTLHNHEAPPDAISAPWYLRSNIASPQHLTFILPPGPQRSPLLNPRNPLRSLWQKSDCTSPRRQLVRLQQPRRGGMAFGHSL